MKREQVIIAVITVMLLCFYAVVPAFGATGTVKIIDRNGEERSNNLNIDGSTKSPGSPSVSDDEEEEEEEEEKSTTGSKLSRLNPVTAGKEMIADGGMFFLERLADSGFKLGMNETEDVSGVRDNYGYAVALIYSLATVEFDPYDNPFIQEMQLRLSIIGLFIVVMFVLLGAVYINVYEILLAENAGRAYILSKRYKIPLNEYSLTIVETCLMLLGGYIILRLTTMIELLFTKLIMIQILDRIMPTGDNTVMYLMMSICYVLIGIALAYRILIIGLFHASYVVFIGLYSFAITREVAIAAFIYYLKLLFLRPIIVGVTVVGVGIISTMRVVYDYATAGEAVVQVLEGLVSNFLIQPLMYSALILILVIICVVMIVGLANVMKASKHALRRYTYGVYR